MSEKEGHVTDPEEDEEPVLEHWVSVQQHTFTNWVNDKLRIHDLQLKKIRTDFKDGVLLCKLMEALKGHKIGRIIQKKVLNHYEASGNLQVAFDALRKDGVRLVNIGAEDVTSGNIKLILGLLWTLIRFYQIGSQSRLPAKALMLSWCNAVLHPHLKVNNFSTDWSDGIALHGLIEYCRPGTCPGWNTMSRNSPLGNCEHAMQLAQEVLDIPMVMRPEDMASTNPDELSGMTYLSYFMSDDSPGFKATLNWVRSKVSPEQVDNFDSDWNSGIVLATLVKSLGGSISISEDYSDWKTLNDNAISVGKDQLGVEPVLTGKDLINPEVDHIGVMAHAAWYEASLRNPAPVVEEEPPLPPPPPPPVHEPPVFDEPPIPPPPPPPIVVPEAPRVNVMVAESVRIDKNVTVTVDTSNLGPGNVSATANSPSGAIHSLVVSRLSENSSHLEYIPNERGSWSLNVLYNGNEVQGSPYTVNVYDPTAAKITRDYGVASQGDEFSFEVDVVHVGLDDVIIYIVHEGVSIPYDVTRIGVAKYRVTFVPEHRGSYTIAVYTGGVEVPGSPFDVVCKLVEGIQARGRALTEGVTNVEAEFEVDTSTLPGHDVDVTVYDPNNKTIPCYVHPGDMNDIHLVTFLPKQSGEHKIEVMYDSLPIRGSPFLTNIRKSQVYIQDLAPYGFVGKQSKFRIDASEMKKGTLEIDSNLPVVSYDKLGQNTYMVTFVPRSTGNHDLMIKYNGVLVEGCPFEVEVKPSV